MREPVGVNATRRSARGQRRHPVVGVATALLEADGRIVHWSAGAEAMLGFSAEEAEGSYAIELMGSLQRRADILAIYERILHGQDWSGVFPVRQRDGHMVDLEIHTYRIDSGDRAPMVLATAVDARAVRSVEADLAVLDSFFNQSPVGMAVYDTETRFVQVNAALAAAHGIGVPEHLGRRVRDVLPGGEGARIEAQVRQVLKTGEPIADARWAGPANGDAQHGDGVHDHTWSAWYSRLQDARGRVFGVSSTVIDVTERHEAEEQAARARRGLALLAEASAAIGSTLDVRQAAGELVTAMVPEVADVCGVHVLEHRSQPGDAAMPADPEVSVMRRVAFGAVSEDFPRDDQPIGQLQRLEPGSPYAEALRLRETVVVAPGELQPGSGSAGGPAGGSGGGSAGASGSAGSNGQLSTFAALRAETVRVTPLVARGAVLGFVSYARREEREPFDDQDITLGEELIVRAATAFDNALLFQRQRDTALARQETLRQANAAQGRLALLNDASVRIGTTLDLQRTAEELIDVVLPRFADFATVDLLSSVMRGDEPISPPLDQPVVLQAVAVAESFPSGLTSIADAVGKTTTRDPHKGYARSLRSGRPVLIPIVDEESLGAISTSPERVAPGLAAGIHSYLMVPLRARGVVLGGAEFIRMQDREPFGPADVALAEELAARAALCIDNARLYRRERATALTLQRSLLPQNVHHTLGMEIAHRYLPSSRVSEVGGDWFDVVPLSCGRVALLVGDVMGHGIRAAATMGQLRTVARTLATLDMEPEQVLTRLDATAASTGQDQFATCICAVYDPVERSGAIASAGHLPPVVVAPDGTTTLLDVPPGPPLGVGGVPFESVEFSLSEHSVLALYTDGLVERRGRDLDDGISLLRKALAQRGRPLEEACDAVLSALVPGGAEDDVALIMAKTVSLAGERVATLALSGDRRMAGQARSFTRAKLRSWGLASRTDLAELLVSELVTNALTHTDRPRQLRLFCDHNLTIEVADSDPRAPTVRRFTDYDESGRGIGLVDELAHRWGSRTTRHGKVVWFELELPSGWQPSAGSAESAE
ncbi:SpoIIE family protein phosphatase [Catenulispora sp. NL8]|uniref:SpoIIE family protein phosphatase n=1 Tax=Catenulispora pinistramenti TaxID=2705254 RepID=A0ABS5KU40_9ACTN|nr:SpoIIE family protein phosphatase [Catenulispora pinistramenti]